MVERVLLGQDNNGNQVLRVSKPGVDVHNAGIDDILIDTDQLMIQSVVQGTFTISSGGQNISVPNLGFAPMVFAYSHDANFWVTYPNQTTVRFNVANLSSSARIYYAVFNIPRG